MINRVSVQCDWEECGMTVMGILSVFGFFSIYCIYLIDITYPIHSGDILNLTHGILA